MAVASASIGEINYLVTLKAAPGSDEGLFWTRHPQAQTGNFAQL